MTETVVVDSSALVAVLVDGGPTGDWVASLLDSRLLAAPELVMFEAANVLRRQLLAGRLEQVEATMAHDDLQDWPIQLWPSLPLADRVWQLRETITAYDAAYVALAERLHGCLVTLDARWVERPVGSAARSSRHRQASSRHSQPIPSAEQPIRTVMTGVPIAGRSPVRSSARRLLVRRPRPRSSLSSRRRRPVLGRRLGRSRRCLR